MEHDRVPRPPIKWPMRVLVVRITPILLIVVGLIPSVTIAVVTWSGSRGLLAMEGHMLVVRDYLWLWGAGHLLESGDVATIFHPHAFSNYLRDIYGKSLDNFVWSYPPSFLFAAIPAGYLPILSGFILYGISQVALIAVVGRLAGQANVTLLAIILSPAVIENALGGQNGGITAALLVGGLLLAGKSPVGAGFLFGLLTVKPQFGILVPFCLLASRDWIALTVAVCTALTLFIASSIAFGLNSWVDFWQQTAPFMTALARADWEGRFFQRLMTTPFMSARSVGLGLTASYCVQLLVSLTACIVAFKIWRRGGTNTTARMAATACLAFLATPYAYNYDMVGISVAVAVLGSCLGTTAWPERLVLALAWLWPSYAFWASVAGLQPLGVLLIAGVAWIGYRRLDVFESSQDPSVVELPLSPSIR